MFSHLTKSAADGGSDPTATQLDDLVHLAATLCEVPVAAVTYVDGDRLRFAARHGLTVDSLPSQDSFCARLMEQGAPLLVPDATQDPCFKHMPIVCSERGYQFYAGFPVHLNTTGARGALCVLDHRPRTLSEAQLRALNTIASQVSLLLQEQARDVSGLKRAEANLRDREEELRQAQKLEAVGKLAGGIAHDFNNLLSAIIGFNEIAIEKLEKGEEITDELEQVRRATNRSAKLTRQILAFARKSVLQPRILVLRELIAESERLIERLIGEDIEVVFRPGRPSSVRVDPSQIEQVVLNLCLNARDAMPEGGRLTIALRDQDASEAAFLEEHPGIPKGHYVLLSIRDTGVGMEPDVLARIFEPFFTTKVRGKGSGLGLSTVHGIIKQSGGHLWVTSEVGIGSTFTLCFPAVVQEEEERGTAHWIVAKGKRETILVAEDDDLLRDLIKQVLSQANYQLLIAKDGEEAVALCADHEGKIDLFLTDVIMPKLNGVEAAKKLQAVRPDLKVVCMSGYADNEILERDVFEKGLPFLRKPVTPNQILATVRAMLDV